MIKKYRLCKSNDFEKTLKSKTRFKNDIFSVICLENSETNHSRYGISVSKKLGNAVVRNRTKRQVRAMLSKITKYQEKVDVVIIVKDGFFQHTFEENKCELEKMLTKCFKREVKI